MTMIMLMKASLIVIESDKHNNKIINYNCNDIHINSNKNYIISHIINYFITITIDIHVVPFIQEVPSFKYALPIECSVINKNTYSNKNFS